MCVGGGGVKQYFLQEIFIIKQTSVGFWSLWVAAKNAFYELIKIEKILDNGLELKLVSRS